VLKRISILLMAVLLGLALAANVAVAVPLDGKGAKNANADELVEGELPQGSSDTPSGWGTVTSQFATSTGAVGDHASGFSEPRLGVGNVARTDHAPGDQPGDHACDVDGDPNTSPGSTMGIPGTSCTGDPGRVT
jgi:hypothetical protein